MATTGDDTDGDHAEVVLVNHVGQCTADLDAATRFYGEVLAFAVERDLAIPDEAAAALLAVEPPVGLRVRYLRRGDFVLELLAFDRPGNPPFRARAMNEPGLTHLSFSVEHYDATVAAVIAHGGQVVFSSPMATMARDPDGQLVELLPMAYRRQVDAARRAKEGA